MNSGKGNGYFSHFGLGQICDIIIVAAAVTLIVGLFVEQQIVGLVGFALFAVGSGVSAVRRFVMLASSPKGTPEFRNSLVVSIAMTAAFAISVAGFILKIFFVI